MHSRISRNQLEELQKLLKERDLQILQSIQAYRYLTTDQIRRLHVTDTSTKTVGLRATTRNLHKLQQLKLIDHMKRRIGGIHPGSSSFVWRLASAGEHLLRLSEKGTRPHHRRFEPSTYFLAHTLSVAEAAIRITELSRTRKVQLSHLEHEPTSWRSYHAGGKIVNLKPDLFAITRLDGYEDHWFFEIDLSTESLAKISEKCGRYLEYYRSGLEQKLRGIFPLVVWLVLDGRRKSLFIEHLQKAFPQHQRVFQVITAGELELLLRQKIPPKGG